MTTPADRTGPDLAERARTVLTHAASSVIEIGLIEVGAGLAEVPDVLAVDADGSLVILTGAAGAFADRMGGQPLPAVTRAALVSPVPGPDRRLDAVTVHGAISLADDVRAALEVVLGACPDRPADAVLGPDASVLVRMTVDTVELDGEPVDPDAYARAAPDPLAPGSDAFVAHLVCAHPDQVVQLAHLLEVDLVFGAHAVAPDRVDRFGVTLRVDGPAGTRRARIDFPAALRGPADLPAAMRELHCRAAQVTACPFSGEPGPRP